MDGSVVDGEMMRGVGLSTKGISFRAKGIRVSCRGHPSFVKRASLHLDTLCVCANCSIGASGVMAVPLLRDEGASGEE